MTTTPLATVRALIADVTQPFTLADSHIAGYLELNAGPGGDVTDPVVIRRAAADALEAIASSETLVSKVIRTQDLATDGTKVAADLRAHAASLRAQADRDEQVGIFDVVDTTPVRRPELAGGWGGLVGGYGFAPYDGQTWGL